MDTKQSFSTSEVAKYCHVTADTIRKWAEAGRIKVFKTPGGHRRIRREELLRFLRENSIPVHPDLSRSGVKVLIIDEDPSVASVVIRFLDRSQNGFDVQVAGDAFDAGYQVAHFRPDVIFFQISISGVDGLDICRRIKELQELASTHIIALLGVQDAGLTEYAVERGASVTLRKPFSPDDLRRALARVGVEVS
jgi:excisionase family DNA binding protein